MRISRREIKRKRGPGKGLAKRDRPVPIASLVPSTLATAVVAAVRTSSES